MLDSNLVFFCWVLELNVESVQFAWRLRVGPASLIYKERLMMTTDRISETFVIFTDTNKKV